MANILSTKVRKAMTLHKPDMELMREEMSLFILGIVLMDLRGLRILNMRSTFRLSV